MANMIDFGKIVLSRKEIKMLKRISKSGVTGYDDVVAHVLMKHGLAELHQTNFEKTRYDVDAEGEYELKSTIDGDHYLVFLRRESIHRIWTPIWVSIVTTIATLLVLLVLLSLSDKMWPQATEWLLSILS